jgi:hypothetical protein
VAKLNSAQDRKSADAYFMSAEDLSAQSGLAVQQDLALATLIGCRTTERNGHHFGEGRSSPSNNAYAFYQASSPGLYKFLADRLCLRIECGAIDLGALFRAGDYG